VKQRADQAGLLGVDRAQLGDHRGLHRDGGFQARDGITTSRTPSGHARLPMGRTGTATPRAPGRQLVDDAETARSILAAAAMMCGGRCLRSIGFARRAASLRRQLPDLVV
jgi:hypothetical protein